MRKKIAIVTHSLRYNYGGILQNYAMQQVLINLGFEPVTLRVGRKDDNRIIPFIIRLVHQIINKIRPHGAYGMKNFSIICKNTDLFIEKHILLSPKMSTLDKKWIIAQHFDGFVVGSDQVLHPASYKNIEEIYLNFVESSHKVMYAASFGAAGWNAYTQKQIQHCSLLLKNFSFIGIRENSGVSAMKEYFRTEAHVVLDPTLLLDAEDYKKCITPTDEHFGVVTYLLDPNEEKQQIVQHVAKALSLPILQAGNDKMDNRKLSPKDRVAPSVESWLLKMSQADFIITDSYHGTLFAIIFKKPFITIGNKKRGLDRFITVLDLLGLSERMIFGKNDEINNIIEQPIDYNPVYKIISEKRKYSYDHLMAGIENSEKTL